MASRVVRVSGFVYALAILVGTGLAMPSGLSEHEMEWRPADEWLPGIADNRASFVASMWVFHLSSVALIVFGVAWPDRLAGAFLAASGGAFLIETTMIIGMGLSGETGALLVFRLHMAPLASLLLALGSLVLGMHAWRAADMPRWLSGLAIVSGVLGLLGGLSLMFEPFSFVRTAGVLAWTAFAGLVGAMPGRRQAPSA